MKKRIIIIHGWGGNPEESWFPWITRELESRGFEIMIPAMPQAEHPTIEAWTAHLATIVPTLDQHIFLIGHSIGCQTILRFLQTRDAEEKIGGALFVAPWMTLTNLESEEEEKIAKPWTEIPIDFEKVKHIIGRSVSIFSDNDPFVPLENTKLFAEPIGSDIIVEHDKGHLNGEAHIFELPSARDAILSLAQ